MSRAVDMGKSRAEYMRIYRQKKREEKLNNSNSELKRMPRSSTERSRDYRARSRAALSILAQTSVTDPPGTPTVVANNAAIQLSSVINKIKKDTANYVEYNIMKHKRNKCSLRLKKGVVPHIFLCQKQNMPIAVVRMGAVKREGLADVNEALAEYDIKSSSILENGEPPEIIDDKVSADAGPSSRSKTTCHDVVRPHTGLMTMPQIVSSKTSDSRSLLVGHHLKEQVGEPSRCLMTSQREKSERNICLPEAKEIITSVYHYLRTEYEYLKSYVSSDCDLTPLGNILMRTAEATGVSEQTVTALLDEGNHPLESTHKTVQRKHSNSSHYTSLEDDNVSDEQYTSRVEMLQVEFEEDEDPRTDVNDKMWVKVEATPSESTFASRSLLSRPHHVKVEPLDFEYEHKLPYTTRPLRKGRQTNIGRKTRKATRIANIRRRERQSRIWQLQSEGLVTSSFIHTAPPPVPVEIKQEPSDIEYCLQNEQESDGLERLKMEFEEEDENHGNAIRSRSNVEATTSDTLHSSEWSQNIYTETGHSQEQLNTTPTRDIIKKSKSKERQQRYRERNREKLKKSEAERRKRIRCLLNTTELSSSSRLEESYKEIIEANSQSSSGLEDPETISLLKKMKAKYALERRREVQRRYREKNREKLKQREAERRQRLLTDKYSSGPRSSILKISSDGGKREDDEEELVGAASLSHDKDQGETSDDIETKRKLQNKVRCKRYRDKRKRDMTINSCIPQQQAFTAEEELKIKRRKEQDKIKSKRYRDRKRAAKLINLQTDQPSKITPKYVPERQSFHSVLIPGSSTRNVPNIPRTHTPNAAGLRNELYIPISNSDYNADVQTDINKSISAEPRVPPDAVHYPVKTEPSE